jgi:hypothetical protein
MRFLKEISRKNQAVLKDLSENPAYMTLSDPSAARINARTLKDA